MRYFITVTLSKHEVTIKYFRDDDGLNRLIPFQGVSWPAPLAVHINDSDIIVGKDALDRFEVSQPNTFYNLFSLIDSGDTYRRFGLNKNTSHLIYLAVEGLLSPLIQSQLGENLGDIKRTIPIGFNFTPDVDASERQHVMKMFEHGDNGDCGGYANIGEIDADSLLAALALKSNHRNHALVIHTSRQNLAVTLYSKSDPKKCIGSKVMKDLGVDRRIMNGVREIKAYIMDKNPNIDFSPIEGRLEKIVEEFIASGKMEVNSKVLINGENYRYSLSIDDLRSNSANMERQFIAQHISQFLHSHSVHPDDTVMVLASPKLQNNYFLPLFKENFESVYCVTPEQTEQMQQQVIDTIVGTGFNFSREAQLINHLEKEWAEIRTYVYNIRIPERQYSEAAEDVSDFVATVNQSSLDHVHREKFLALAKKLRDELSMIEKKERDAEKEKEDRIRRQREEEEREQAARLRREEEQRIREQQELERRERERAQSATVNVTPPKSDYITQLIDSVTEEIDQFINYGEYQSARNSYNDLYAEIQQAGQLDKYADILATLKKRCNPEQPIHHHEPPKAPVTSNDPLTDAIRARDFRQARKICKQNDDFDRYQTMRELEDAYKKYVVAEKYFNQYVAEQNRHAIDRAIREITEYERLLTSVNAPHPEVDTLLNKYKNAI